MLQTLQSILGNSQTCHQLIYAAPALQRAVAHRFSTTPLSDQDRVFQNIYGVHDTSIQVDAASVPFSDTTVGGGQRARLFKLLLWFCDHLAGCRTFGRLVQNKRTDCEGRHSCEHMCTAVTVPYTCKPGLLQHIAVADSVAMCLASTCARAISRSHACVSRHYQAVEQEHPCCHAPRRHRAQTGSPVKSRKVG